jgi:hypothetical protein
MSSKHLVEDAKIVQALQPATDAAGRTGVYISLKNARRVFVIVHIDQGNAATIALTLFQATAVAATGEKAITALVPTWANLDAAASDALVRQADAVSFTTDAGVKRKIVVFCVEGAMLDVSNGFDCFTIKTGASNVANFTQAIYILEGMRYGGVTPPTAITD